MTPEEVFAQLRDIHTPAVTGIEAASYDFRPLLVFAALTAVALLLGFLWNRAGTRRLINRIDAKATKAEQRDAVVRLVDGRRRRADAGPAPEAAFQPPGALTEEGVSRLRRWARRRIG